MDSPNGASLAPDLCILGCRSTRQSQLDPVPARSTRSGYPKRPGASPLPGTQRRAGLAWVLTVVLAIWVGDSVALFAGRAFGSRKLAPMISPNKSQEGALGGLVASMAVGAVSFQGFGLGDWKMGLIAGAVIGLAGQIGDLAESVLKRQAGVKDSGSVVPGHGGILDRIDALLFAFPAGFLLAVGLERFGA